MNQADNVTQILKKVEDGDSSAAEALLLLVYDELRQMAAEKLARERPGQTLQATALVHEAYFRLVRPKESGWNDRRHFFRVASMAMRQLLTERGTRFSRRLPSKLTPGTVAFFATDPDLVHDDFVTHAWVDDPVAWTLSRVPGYRR